MTTHPTAKTSPPASSPTSTSHTRPGPATPGTDEFAQNDPSRGETMVEREGKPAPRLPHEHDQSAGSQTPTDGQPTDIGRQAHDDVTRGLTDTDRGPELEKLNRRL